MNTDPTKPRFVPAVKPPWAGDCLHETTAFVRRGPHVAELCLHCGRNTRDRRRGGAWVPRAELRWRGLDPANLPTWEEAQAKIADGAS
jgi:hypothetical protein